MNPTGVEAPPSPTRFDSKRNLRRFGAGCALVLASCVAPAERGRDRLPIELDAVLRSYEVAWRSRDAAALTALFTEDGWIMSVGRPPVHGHAEIAARYASSGGPLELRPLYWERNGDLAVILGAYARAPGEPDVGKFSLSLRRGPDGRWRILSDMDNENTRR